MAVKVLSAEQINNVVRMQVHTDTTKLKDGKPDPLYVQEYVRYTDPQVRADETTETAAEVIARIKESVKAEALAYAAEITAGRTVAVKVAALEGKTL
ncbi:MAG: hypothetical protein NTZ05_20255 [Chloroflexi bacterium]|nr:hypothetical protein [Chloroflexota bacterium]